MKLREVGELPLLESIRVRFAQRRPRVLLGIGDDAAVLSMGGEKVLATTDMMLEGVHFDLAFTTPAQLGFKLVSVNVSDIYAMGGRPLFALLGLAAPGKTEGPFVEALLRGAAEALRLYGMSLVGGDLSSSMEKIALSATVLGDVERPVPRSGARAGHRIYVTGSLGDSACGLRLLQRRGRPVDFDRPFHTPLPWDVMHPLFRRHLMPVVRKPRALAKAASSMIDVSDGLFVDLGRLCGESNVGARLRLADIPLSEAMKKAAAFLGLEPLKLATSGGEDYELLFTAPPGEKVRGAVCIGEITRSGLSVVHEDGREVPFEPEGYLHWGGDAC